ncbi:MAG TPA: hypothetical protein VFN50_02645 [Acidimicrobiales bacterium]|nr:hypothetical protein [Acidimicrobiales bacterium]
MAHVLRIALSGLTVLSLVVVAGYVVAFGLAAAWTVVSRGRRDPSQADLDRVLGEVLAAGERSSAVPPLSASGNRP